MAVLENYCSRASPRGDVGIAPYIFKKARLQEVANTLKNWYGVNIVLSSGASDIIYTGVVNKEEKLEVFLRRLEEVSNVKCNCNGKFVTIY